jgi:hypothetical protein
MVKISAFFVPLQALAIYLLRLLQFVSELLIKWVALRTVDVAAHTDELRPDSPRPAFGLPDQAAANPGPLRRLGDHQSGNLQGVLPKAVRHWTLTTLREKLIKIGAKVVRHSRKIVFQMAEVAVPRELFRAILEGIERLRLPAVATG